MVPRVAEGQPVTRSPSGPATPDGVRASVARVRAEVEDSAARSGRSGDDVTIVAAVKYVDAATCAMLVGAGVVDLAENRLAHLVAHQDSGQVPDVARWHFIGRLQSREAVAVAERTSLVHTLCTESAARRLAGAVTGSGSPHGLLVQVNVDGDRAKDGVAAADVERLLEELPEQLVVRGFMSMPAWSEDPERSRPAFAALRAMRDRLAERFAGRHELHALSIGTSQDYAVAVEEGATHVRLGRILYAHEE